MTRVFQINIRNFLKEHKIQNVNQIFDEFWCNLKSNGITTIWLLGIWSISPNSVTQSKKLDFKDFVHNKNDLIGSCFAVEDYTFDPAIGLAYDFEILHRKLNSIGLKLMLDFVPNHFGISQSLLDSNSEIFLSAPAFDPKLTFEHNNKFYYFGKDPHFEPWNDTLQLDYSQDSTQDLMLSKLQYISQFCDSVRCDMSMLVVPEVFSKTWNIEVKNNFWKKAITVIKSSNPNFVFLAEVYWGLESTMIELGFDYAYNKAFVEDLIHHNWDKLDQQIQLTTSACFLENHDENRIASLLDNDNLRLAFALFCVLPSLQIHQYRQWQGEKIRLPIQLCQVQTFVDPDFEQFCLSYLTNTKDLTLTNKTRFDTCCWILELKPDQKLDSNFTKTLIILNFDVNSKQYNLSQLIKSELHNSNSRPNSKLLVLDQNWQMILTIASTKELSNTNNITITIEPKDILIVQIQE